MKRRHQYLVSGILWIMLLIHPPPSGAGVFIQPIDCGQLSVEPPRYLARFWMYDRFFTPLCEVKIEPYSYNGSPLVPILACTSPSSLSCDVDSSTGIATYRPPGCVDSYWYYNDSLALVIGESEAWFLAHLITTDGFVYETNTLYFACNTTTGVSPSTQGASQSIHVRPNPARTVTLTRMVYSLARPGAVRLALYDVRGARLVTLVDRDQEPGEHTVTWDARDEHGRRVAPGVYLVGLETGQGLRTARMVLVE